MAHPQRPCFQFKKGECTRGEACIYSHDTAVFARTATMPCRDFLAGTCRHGAYCCYQHAPPSPPKPKPSPATPKQSPASKNPQPQSPAAPPGSVTDLALMMGRMTMPKLETEMIQEVVYGPKGEVTHRQIERKTITGVIKGKPPGATRRAPKTG